MVRESYVNCIFYLSYKIKNQNLISMDVKNRFTNHIIIKSLFMCDAKLRVLIQASGKKYEGPSCLSQDIEIELAWLPQNCPLISIKII